MYTSAKVAGALVLGFGVHQLPPFLQHPAKQLLKLFVAYQVPSSSPESSGDREPPLSKCEAKEPALNVLSHKVVFGFHSDDELEAVFTYALWFIFIFGLVWLCIGIAIGTVFGRFTVSRAPERRDQRVERADRALAAAGLQVHRNRA